jgi:uncharacterized protein YxjI
MQFGPGLPVESVLRVVATPRHFRLGSSATVRTRGSDDAETSWTTRRRSRPGAAGHGCRGAVVGAAAGGGRRGAGPGSHRYQMRQRMFSIGDDFFIEDDQGRRAFKVDGKALRVRSTLKFEDANGRELYKIQEKLARVRDSMTIERPDGGAAAKVHNALITPLRDRWSIDVPGGEDMSTQGNIVQHEYRIEQGRTTVATVSKKWFRVRDSYGVDIAPGQDDALILAITVVIDMMAHQGR